MISDIRLITGFVFPPNLAQNSVFLGKFRKGVISSSLQEKSGYVDKFV